jgi:iron complex transport system permease protein
MLKRSPVRINLLLGFLLLTCCVMSLLLGNQFTPVATFMNWLSGLLTGQVTGADDSVEGIILGQIRAPRIALAAMTGFALGLSGAAIQGLLRNPLAEPSLLGASNSAALGAVVVIYLGLSGTLSYAVPVAASIAALFSVGLLLVLAGRGSDTIRLILAGFAVSAFAGAGIALALNLSPNVFAALEIAFWLLGAVENRTWQHVLLALPLILPGCVLLFSGGRSLDALSLGEDTARSLGVGLAGLRVRVVSGMALAVGGAVAVTGVIGFVGLIAPHLARPLTGAMPSRSLLPSALIGALMLVVADSFIRILPTTTELKLGVVTAFIGVPLFLVLLLRGGLLRGGLLREGKP